MNRQQLQRLYGALWPDEGGGLRRTWMILDGARDGRVRQHLRASYRERYPLFGTGIAPELAVAGPTLLLLKDNDLSTRNLIVAAWGNAWGVFVRSEAHGPALCRHLARLLRVRDELGRRLMLRFYDPRVLNLFLPTCDGEQLAAFFAGAETFLAESDGADALLRFQCDPAPGERPRKLTAAAMPLAAGPEERVRAST